MARMEFLFCPPCSPFKTRPQRLSILTIASKPVFWCKIPGMSHYIRLSFRRPGCAQFDTAIKEGIFHGVSPMRHQGRSCRALEASSLLSSTSARHVAQADFLLRNAQNDPDKIMFLDGSAGAVWGSLLPFPECADWTFDYESRRWMGSCRDRDDVSFEAPLFSFWLLQALWIARPDMHSAAAAAPSYSELGSKRPIRARADLLWDWLSAMEPRLDLFCLAHRLSLDPSNENLRQRMAIMSHPSLVEPFARLSAERFSSLAGSDLALSSLLTSHELFLSTDGSVPSPNGRPHRL